MGLVAEVVFRRYQPARLRDAGALGREHENHDGGADVRMAMTHVAILVALAGATLLVTGAVLLFGPWAMIVAGVVLLAAALVPDWETGA